MDDVYYLLQCIHVPDVYSYSARNQIYEIIRIFRKSIELREIVSIQDFIGASDQHGFVTMFFHQPIIARFVRILPTDVTTYTVMKFEMYGCFVARDQRNRE